MASNGLMEIATSILEDQQRRQQWHDVAVGVWSDEPNRPGVVVVVAGGRVVDVVIAAPYMALRAEELSAVVNAAVMNAFVEWRRAAQEGGTA